jgi:quercetin 2,3-dioxygenase
MHPRAVERIVKAQPTSDGAGVKLSRCIGGHGLDYCDPFLLLDHFGSDDPDEYLAGFPMHPHRGIETVTYMLEGEVDHRDTLGNEGSIGAGDVQWMTSGGGIMHEEMPRPPEEGGKLDGFQLWVNMPASLKMSEPRYRGVEAGDIPVVRREDGVEIRVVAGVVDGVEGPVRELYADPLYADVAAPAGHTFELPTAADHTVFAYVFEGEAVFGTADGPKSVGERELALFGEGDSVRVVTGDGPVRFLLAAARPLGEPVARYGPFVMNTREEVERALLDLHEGTFVWTPEDGR